MGIFDKKHIVSLFYLKNSEREVHERHHMKINFGHLVPSVALYIVVCSLTVMIP